MLRLAAALVSLVAAVAADALAVSLTVLSDASPLASSLVAPDSPVLA
ncbi:hypothetical protein EJG51_016525 [Undibacterium piscinae]|uniref:Uncharacterized protein n=1 Tax=Undibacterium piscinae TaxID=2495591 RepID=A0A6M4A7A0_9BURK|nr:hypothetical protein EJG51_016525 [Undibacterium piscinae]